MITAYALEIRYRSSHIETCIPLLRYRKALLRGLTSRSIRWENRAYEVGHSLLSIFDIHLYDHRSDIHSYSHIVLSSVCSTQDIKLTNSDITQDIMTILYWNAEYCDSILHIYLSSDNELQLHVCTGAEMSYQILNSYQPNCSVFCLQHTVHSTWN